MAKMRKGKSLRKAVEMVMKGAGPANLSSNGRMRNRNKMGTANPQASTRSDGRKKKFVDMR